ncbi:MAG: type 1 glutamine amidotransferase domain-containing protein [Opitutaceae bacterium]|nr:type 1 glutamine amidotransferase domain-containing protein [Opitutaceae bacterium]
MSSAAPASAARKRVLMIVANPATSPVTGWPVGFWAAELTHPWTGFVHAGYEVTLASPRGGRVAVDSYSDPRDASGYSKHDIISLGVLSHPGMAAMLENTAALAAVNMTDYDAIFVCGGQSPMVTFIDDAALHAFVARAYEAGKVVALVCHGTCVLLKVRTSDGKLLVDGKTWTGFANSEERFAEQAVGVKIQPFWVETEAKKIAGTNFITHNAFEEFAVRDGRLITGQQQNSGRAAAALVIAALGQ